MGNPTGNKAAPVNTDKERMQKQKNDEEKKKLSGWRVQRFLDSPPYSVVTTTISASDPDPYHTARFEETKRYLEEWEKRWKEMMHG